MSTPELASQSQSETQVKRPVADFPPNNWGDQFLIYHTDEKEHASKRQEAEKLREEVRRELLESANDPTQQMNLIDEIQRLGVAYHFEDEIKEALQRLYTTYYSDHDDHDHDDLCGAALRFRLLREADYHISAERFNKFKDENGNFKECVTEDVRGMLSLYDAAQLRIHGEDILDEALAFTAAQLTKSLETATITSIPLAAQVRHALKQQMRKNLPRLEAKHYMMYVYPNMASQNKSLLKLAKLEFNLQQSMYRKELSVLTRYWRDLGLAANSSFARDRLVECYFIWAVGLFPEPENCLPRSLVCKFTTIFTVIDDLFDAYGMIDELEIFTEAVERWDVNCMKQLPEYMQPSFEAILNLGAEIEEEMAKQGRTYRVPYAIEALKFVTRGYLKEAQWLNQKYTPTMEEHREVSVLATSTVLTVIVVGSVGMGDVVTKETFDWMLTNPKIFQASETVTRFVDDIITHKFEHQREHHATSVECYMKQYGASEEEAYEELSELVVNAWNDINEECLKKPMPKQILEVAINFARVMDVFYKDEDIFTHLKKPENGAIISMLIDPVPEN